MATATDISELAELPDLPYIPGEPSHSHQSLPEESVDDEHVLRLVIGVDFGTTYTGKPEHHNSLKAILLTCRQVSHTQLQLVT